MADVVRKEPPVLIENVNVIINVFNIGNTELNHLGIQSSARSHQEGLCPIGSVGGVSVGATPNSCSSEASCSLQKSTEEFIVPTTPEPQYPLGWIALHNGDTVPFGVQSIATEIPKFGDLKTWKQIRVCLPTSLLADNECDLYCPVPSCREKLMRNKSMSSHIKKHLGIATDNSNSDGQLPCPLYYYCQDKKCQYYVETAEKWFKAYKNLKQHYKKVHAPKLFECDMCQKTFSTMKDVETHKLMCGEKYVCSTCNSAYNSLETLQTHCRRKAHSYDHVKYKDKRNSVKQELQSKILSTAPAMTATTGTSYKKQKGARKLPTIRPKFGSPSTEVFNTIQAFCRQAGVKVDYGCQTVCTALVEKSDLVEAVVTTSQPFSHKKRKSTDTQTNMVKFRAACLDQKHNATNTNRDWKKVITSDSQTQTAENSDTVDLQLPKPTETTMPFSDEFATIKISETETASPATPVSSDKVYVNCTMENIKQEVEDTTTEVAGDSNEENNKPSEIVPLKVDIGPSLYPEFISFLEAADCATQTDPDMFDILGGDCLGINVNLDDVCGTEKHTYVSVSSTASQTAVESVSSKSLSAEDYEALLNTGDDVQALSDFMKSVDGSNDGSTDLTFEGGNEDDVLFDWEDIVEEVYRDKQTADQSKVSLS